MPCPPGIELTDLPRVNPGFYRETLDPFTGTTTLAVPALRPDVVLITCREADEAGNVAFSRFPFTDRLMALSARTLIVQVERVVSSDNLTQLSPGETLPAFLIAAVVVAPYGCHPTGSPGSYERDEEAIAAYLEAARDPVSFDRWLSEMVTGVDEEGYRRRTGI